MTQCQVMQDNHVQCPNPAKYSNEGVDYCRLHFSYALAKAADAKKEMLNPTVINEEDRADLDSMIKLQMDKNTKIADSNKKGE